MKQLFISIFAISIVLNLIFIDYAVFKGKLLPEKQATVATPIQSPSPAPSNFCPAGCMGLIKDATQSSQPAVAKAPTNTYNISNTAPKESFISFGSGSNESDDWQDVPGLQAYIDSSNYGSIKSVTFEASIHVPTGNETADVRLYDSTDGHPVWFSEMHFDGGTTAKLLTSQNLKLDSGNKLYTVQMKTQLKFPALLDSSRLRIVTY